MWSSSLGIGLRELAFSEVPYRAQRLHAYRFSISIIKRFTTPRYATQMGSTDLTIDDVSVVCNARYLDPASQGRYAYDFTVPPSTHVRGIFFVFYDNGTAPMLSNVTLAALLQRCIYHVFLETGSPNGPGLPPLARNENRVVQDLNTLYIGPVEDEPLSRKRCMYWQQALYR